MLLRQFRVVLLAGAALAAGAFRLLRRVGRVEVKGDSMRPSLLPGDRLLTVRKARSRPGDLVVVAHPLTGALMVKRVTAVSGGSVHVAGDNPVASTDSRAFGPLPGVLGRPVYRYHPAHRTGWLGRTGPEDPSPHHRR